jgi:hypothetical protein
MTTSQAWVVCRKRVSRQNVSLVTTRIASSPSPSKRPSMASSSSSSSSSITRTNRWILLLPVFRIAGCLQTKSLVYYMSHNFICRFQFSRHPIYCMSVHSSLDQRCDPSGLRRGIHTTCALARIVIKHQDDSRRKLGI